MQAWPSCQGTQARPSGHYTVGDVRARGHMSAEVRRTDLRGHRDLGCRVEEIDDGALTEDCGRCGVVGRHALRVYLGQLQV